MKNILKDKQLVKFLIGCLIVSIATFSIKIFVKEPENIIENQVNKSFNPDAELLKSEMWTRVSEYRFESNFLRLAVEWENNYYYLIEIDEKKRIIYKSNLYSDIGNKIAELTLN